MADSQHTEQIYISLFGGSGGNAFVYFEIRFSSHHRKYTTNVRKKA